MPVSPQGAPAATSSSSDAESWLSSGATAPAQSIRVDSIPVVATASPAMASASVSAASISSTCSELGSAVGASSNGNGAPSTPRLSTGLDGAVAASAATGSASLMSAAGSTKSTLPKLSSERLTAGERSRRWRRIERPAGESAGSRSIQSSLSSCATRSTGIAMAISSSANSRTSAGGGSANATDRALAARTGGGTFGRSAFSRAIASASAGTRPRPIRSTSCRQADWAPNGVDMSAERTVSRLSSKRKSGAPDTAAATVP